MMERGQIFQQLGMTLLCLFLLYPVNAQAGEKVDFSGEWVLNESKSNLGEGRFFSSTKMTVKQEESTIMIERTSTGRDGEQRTRSETLTMDGKENVNKSENRSSTTTVSWSDDGISMTLNSNREFSRQGETFEMKSEETWTLSGDGNTLTIQSTTSSPRGERSVTLVYDKKF
jgi:hypothetical protein